MRAGLNPIRDQEVYHLILKNISENITSNEKESKRFDKLLDYQTDLTFEPLSYERYL